MISIGNALGWVTENVIFSRYSMRIAIFTDNFYPELGGISDSVGLLAKTLGARGHKVLCLAPSAYGSDYALSHLPEREVDLGENVTIRRFPSVRISGSTLQTRIAIPTFTRWHALEPFRPDVIHTNTFFSLGWEAVRAARKLRVPLAGTNHSAINEFRVYAPFGSEWVGRMSVRGAVWYYNHCGFVSCPSRSAVQELTDAGLHVPHGVMSNPIDVMTFCLRSPDERAALKRKLGFSRATCVYAGRFGIEKNIDVLLRAIALVKKDIPDVLLALAGHGRDESRLRVLVSELGIVDNVRFLGTLSQAALAEAFSAAEVFVIASTSETQSMVLLQAMSCGLPAVGADWRSLHEYIPEDVGFRARSLDHADFAKKMLPLLLDAQLRSRTAQEAVRYAGRFSPEMVAERWEHVYRALINRTSLEDVTDERTHPEITQDQHSSERGE
jgi:1,2-diacylglycerol 3-alpha-glucosyltransferase